MRFDQLSQNKFFDSSNFSFAFPLRGKANESLTPQIKKRRSLLYSNMGAANNFRKISFLIRAIRISTNQSPQNPKWPPGGPKMADGVWKGVYPQVLGRSRQLLLNKFFDPGTPSMRKVDDGEERKKKRKKKKEK